jgi:hypothetical protein
MLDYVYGHDELVSHFVATLIPHCRRGFGPNAKAIGIIEDSRLIAGLVYYNYDPEAEIIEIAGAALPKKNWLTRGTMARMYQYPFIQCGCQMVVQRTPADDTRLLGMLASFDYTFVTVPRLFGRERDGVVCSLTYEDWVNNRFNQRLKHHLEEIEEAA